MKYGLGDYSLFLDFIETYAECGFKGIDPSDPLMVELEEMMEANIRVKVVHGCLELIRRN